MKLKYLKLQKVEGPLVILSGVKDAVFGEIVDIEVEQEGHKKGKVVQIDRDLVIIQVFEGTAGISLNNTSVSFTGKPMEIPLSRDILGRTFNGIGEPIDGAGFYADSKYDVNGRPINPVGRVSQKLYRNRHISPDGLASVRGQKLPLFSGDGLPTMSLRQIVKQARISGDEENNLRRICCNGYKDDILIFSESILNNAE